LLLSVVEGWSGLSLNVALIVGYFGFLVGGLVLHSRSVVHPWLFLLRGFFPKWQFFHALGRTPRLYFRSERADEWSDWRKFTPRGARRVRDLFHNPKVNLALSEQNLVELLANDLATCADDAAALGLVSYRMVDRLARLKAGALSGPCAYQFRICLERPGAPADFESDTILLSPICPANGWER
jgi:hypothetical protein